MCMLTPALGQRCIKDEKGKSDAPINAPLTEVATEVTTEVATEAGGNVCGT